MAHMVPYLSFNGNCKEAMEYYQSCLGGELTFMTFGETPMGAQTPDEMKPKIMHSMLRQGDFILMASDIMLGSDGMGQTTLSVGNSLTLTMVGSTKEEVVAAYGKLAEHGQVTQPLVDEFFGTFGQLVDKYGFGWMFQYGADNQL